MKKTIKSIMAMLALTSIIFASCSDDAKKDPVTPSSSSVTMTLNGGGHKEIAISQFIDTLSISGTVTITGGDKIARLEVNRYVLSIPGVPKLLKVDSTLSTTSTSIKINDIRAGDNLAALVPDDKLTYLVTITDSKGKVTSDSVVFIVKSLSVTASSIILGASINPLNTNHFLGYANNFQRYSEGLDSLGKDPFGNTYKPARRNSDKIDFVFFSNNSSPLVKAALYSPDYPFAVNEGFNSEISNWPTKRNTMFIRLGAAFSNSQFNNSSDPSNLAVVNMLRGLKFDGNDVDPVTTTKLPVPINKIAKLVNEEIIAFKTQDGKTGLMLIAVIPTNDTQGTYQVQIKMMP